MASLSLRPLYSSVELELICLCSVLWGVQDTVLFFAGSGHLGVVYLSEACLQPPSDSELRLNMLYSRMMTSGSQLSYLPSPPWCLWIWLDSSQGRLRRNNQALFPPISMSIVFILIYFFGCTVQYEGSYFPDLGLNSSPLK